MNIFVTSLAARPDRLAETLEMLAKRGLTCEVFEALDGKAMKLSTPVTSPKLVTPENAEGKIPCGRIGSYITRLMLLRECYRRGLQSVMVMEDDVKLHDEFTALALRALMATPPDYDLLYLGCWDLEPDKAKKINEAVKVPGKAILTHCVIYSREGMRKVIGGMAELRETCDMTIAELIPDLKIYAAEPHLAWQRKPDDTHGKEVL